MSRRHAAWVYGDPERSFRSGSAAELRAINAELGPLFDRPLLVHTQDPPASREAAIRAQGSATEHREMVVAALENAGPRGMTAHEIDLLHGWSTPSGSPAGRRLSELLREKPPRSVRLEAMRASDRGGPAHVHVSPEQVQGQAVWDLP